MNNATSLRLLQLEMVLTATLLSIPIMVPFYQSIGMDQAQIGLSQALFTLALLMVNVPTGWLADRFSRKVCNAVGDLGCAVSLVLYSQAQSFVDVVLIEIAFGISMAFTQGADDGLFKAYADAIDPTGRSYVRKLATVRTWQPLAQAVALVLGGFVGAQDIRLGIGVSAIPYFVGAVLSMIMRETGERLQQEHAHPVADMWLVSRRIVGANAHVRWLIIAYAVGREATHVTVWVLTPVLLVVGVPLQFVAIGWVVNMMANVAGARLAGRYSHRLSDWQRFLFPILAVGAALVVMGIHLSLATVWLYAVLGVVQGWTSVVLMPMLQARVANNVSSTVSSIAKSCAQLLYIPLVWAINAAGVVDVRLSLLATAAVFVSLGTVTAWKLRQCEKK